MKTTISAGALALALAAACGDSGDLGACRVNGTWTSQVTGYGKTGTAVFTADGEMHLLSHYAHYEDIDGVTLYGIAWQSGWDGVEWADTLELDRDGDEHGRPSVARLGDTVHAVWSAEREGADGPRKDVFYATTEGSTWSEPVNLTARVEEPNSREAGWVQLAAGPDGQLAIAYGSRLTEPRSSPYQVRVARLEEGALAEEPVTVLPDGCAGTVAFDGAGHLHVLATCAIGEESQVAWATDASGSWQDGELTTGGFAGGPELAASADGELHALWAETTDGLLLHSRLVDGAWTEPVAIAAEAAGGDLVFAPDGRLLVVHASANGSPADVRLLSSSDGERFTDGCTLDRPDSGALESLGSLSLAIDPAAGTPVVVAGYSNMDYTDTLVLGWVER